MSNVAVEGSDSAGGPLISAGQSFVTIDGAKVIVLGDPVTPHGVPPHSPAPVMVEGVPWVTIEGIPICVSGNLASCGHSATGRPHVTVE